LQIAAQDAILPHKFNGAGLHVMPSPAQRRGLNNSCFGGRPEGTKSRNAAPSAAL
jgi:hypothetical protein